MSQKLRMSWTKPWHCNCCGLCNSYLRSKCQACFNGNYIPCNDMCKCVIINPTNRNLLVHGYLRRNIYEIKMPKELSQICLKFYNDIMNWKLTDDDLCDFYQNVGERLIIGPKFKMNDISFELNIMLKLFKKEYHVIFGFMFNQQSFTNNIKNVTINYMLCCHEIDYQYKHTKILNNNIDNKALWYWPQIKFDEIKKLNYNELNFGCYADILCIDFIDGKREYFGYSKMNIYNIFKWKLNENELQRFKHCRFDHSIYSQSFNNHSLCIVLSPNGLSILQQSEGLILIKIKLLRLPRGIGGFDADFCIQITSNISHSTCIYQEKLKYFNYDAMDDRCIGKTVTFDSFKDVETIKLIITMNICKVYDDKNREIEKNKWSQYGFVK